jgi:hypothetical protein
MTLQNLFGNVRFFGKLKHVLDRSILFFGLRLGGSNSIMRILNENKILKPAQIEAKKKPFPDDTRWFDSIRLQTCMQSVQNISQQTQKNKQNLLFGGFFLVLFRTRRMRKLRQMLFVGLKAKRPVFAIGLCNRSSFKKKKSKKIKKFKKKSKNHLKHSFTSRLVDRSVIDIVVRH